MPTDTRSASIPAVLAAWDERLGRYEHFAWGVLPEIAARLGRRAGDLEADLHHRRDDLAGLVKGGVTKLDEVQRLVAGYRVQYGGPHGDHGDRAPRHAAGFPRNAHRPWPRRWARSPSALTVRAC